MSTIRLLAVATLLALLVACTPDVRSQGQRPAAARTAVPSVLVTRGIGYAAAPPGWWEPTFDLYVPADAGEPPLVVIVPDAGADFRAPDYVGLARDLADAGVAAAVTQWGVESGATGDEWSTAEVLTAQVEQGTAEIGCALRVVARKVGPRVGTRAQPVVVVGQGAGANAAAMAVLTEAPEFDSCFVGGDVPHVAAATLWNGDWLGGMADDLLGGGTRIFLEAYTPWPSVDSLRRSTYVELGVNANRLVARAVEAGPTTSYLTFRDPSGALTRDLDRVGAFNDGRIDPVDVTRGFSVGLRRGGLQSREREVHGEGDPDTWGPRVRAVIVQSVVQLTRL